jgi:hypothetical protein
LPKKKTLKKIKYITLVIEIVAQQIADGGHMEKSSLLMQIDINTDGIKELDSNKSKRRRRRRRNCNPQGDNCIIFFYLFSHI